MDGWDKALASQNYLDRFWPVAVFERRNVCNSDSVGCPAVPPTRMADRAPQAFPIRKHSASGAWYRYADTNPASNESPAPVVSTALTLKPVWATVAPSRVATAPRRPRLITAHRTFVPSVFNPAFTVLELVNCEASRSFTNSTSV